jgi:hypothetical protein
MTINFKQVQNLLGTGLKPGGLGFLLITVLLLCLGSLILDARASSRSHKGLKPVEGAIANVPLATESQQDFPSIFQESVQILRSKISFPLLLPKTFPFEVPPYAILEKASKSKYAMILGYTAFCNGNSGCRYGSLAGELVSGKLGKGLSGEKVEISKGLSGYFKDGSCKKSLCEDSFLTFYKGKALYKLGIKGGRQQDLLKMAQSLVEVPPMKATSKAKLSLSLKM